jgi:predicted CopG family antitoxin
MKSNRATLNVDLMVKERLMSRMKYGDSFSQTINKLMDENERLSSEIKNLSQPKQQEPTADN